MQEIGLNSFVDFSAASRWRPLNDEEIRVTTTSITIGKKVVQRFKQHHGDETIRVKVAYSPILQALYLKPAKTLEDGFSWGIDESGRGRINNIPLAFKTHNVARGSYLLKDIPDVYFYQDRSLPEENHAPKKPFDTCLDDAIPEVGDIVMWVGRPKKGAPFIVTGKLEAISKLPDSEGNSEEYGKVKALSNRYLPLGDRLIKVKMSNLIIREKKQ